MLMLLLGLLTTVNGQYPYPPASPAAESLPYPPPAPAEGPYPPARATEVYRPQPVSAGTQQARPVVGAIPRPQPVLIRKEQVRPYPAYSNQQVPRIEARPIYAQKMVQPYATRQPDNRYTYPSAPSTTQAQDSPYPAQRPQPFAEGGDLSPNEIDAPQRPETRYGLPAKVVPSGSGGELSPEELELPPNTQINLQDDRLQYSHGFSDDQGTQVREQGSLLSTNGGWEYVIAKKGSYSYVSPEGTPITVKYIADHNGYRVLPN